MTYNPLIFGKNVTERIVSIEIVDPNIELYIQNDNGDIRIEYLPNRYWILAKERIHKSWSKLKGELHYKYGKQFTERQDFQKWRGILGKKNDIFTIWNAQESAMVKDGITLFKGMKTSDISVLSFDLETTGTKHDDESKILIIANTFRDSKGDITRKMFCYDKFDSTKAMLEAWTEWVRAINPTVICGHNINTFDFPYLQYIADKEQISLNLGRDGSSLEIESRESKFRKEGSQFIHYNKCRVFGRHIIDTFFLAIKYDIATRKYESYGLKNIIKQEGLEAEDRQFYDASLIRKNYQIPEEWTKIQKYAEFDGDDALKLYDLMCPAYFYMSQSIPKTYQQITESASGAQINLMLVRSYLQEMHSLPQKTESKPFEGAISRGEPGIYKNVSKVDISSLYPSIMLEYEVYDKDKDPAANFLKLLQYFTKERLINKALGKKDKYYDDLQNGQKILINSCYGFMGTNGLLFNCPEAAEFVTAKGREILQKAITWCEEKKFIFANADTDSISYCKSDMTEITELERKSLLSDLNSLYPERIKFEDDGYFKCVIIVKAKNYVLWDGIKVKTKGSSLKASTKCPALKEFIQRIIQSILDEKYNYVEIYEEYVKEILSIKDITRWAVRKTITDKVLAAERTNELKVMAAIEDSEDEVSEGDKIYVYYKDNDMLALVDKFDGNYNIDRLLKNLYDTAKCYATIIPKETFVNYSLKKNKEALEAFK